MITKKIACPSCKHKFNIQVNPGEKVTVSCPQCHTQGIFRFPDMTKTIDTSSYSLQISNLSKTYKDVRAVNNLSLQVRKGEIFGLLGPNGAGKTTTIKAILGLIRRDDGTITINGFDSIKDDIEARKKVGYLPERVSFYENLTPIQTLNFFCELRGVDKSIVEPLISEVGLEEAKHRKVGTFSKGMVQLLGVAQVQLGNPSIYILDEPMGGLDARWVKTIREKIRMLNKRGATVILSSHILSEVEQVCDRVAIIKKGSVIAQDTVANLNNYLHIKPRLEILIQGLQGRIPKILQQMEGITALDVQEDRLFVTCDSSLKSDVITALKEAGFKVIDIKITEPSLEDAFIKLIEGGA